MKRRWLNTCGLKKTDYRYCCCYCRRFAHLVPLVPAGDMTYSTPSSDIYDGGLSILDEEEEAGEEPKLLNGRLITRGLRSGRGRGGRSTHCQCKRLGSALWSGKHSVSLISHINFSPWFQEQTYHTTSPVSISRWWKLSRLGIGHCHIRYDWDGSFGIDIPFSSGYWSFLWTMTTIMAVLSASLSRWGGWSSLER